MEYLNTVITGTGCYIPEQKIENKDYFKSTFFEKDQTLIKGSGEDIVRKFRDITGILERRWATKDQTTSEIATFAAERAIKTGNIDRETIDHIIVANNFGDVMKGTIQTDLLPSIAARVKNKLGIENPECVAYDIVLVVPDGFRE